MKTEAIAENMNYRIEHVGDFLKVPPDRLSACLQEFQVFLEIVRPLPPFLGVSAFEWIDDGEGTADVCITVTLETQSKTEAA